MDFNEHELYRAAIHGDRDAFEMIIRTHSRALFAIAYGILQNREEAEDAVQDALVKASKTRWRVREPEKLRAWLATIARHRAHDILRRRRTVPLSEQMPEPVESEPNDTIALDRQLPDVEKIYNDIKGLTSPKVQIANAQLDRDYSGRVSARVSMMIAPEESDAVIGKVKGTGRVENFQMQTERISQAVSGRSEKAKTKREKVELNINLSREEQEQALQQTTLRIRTSTLTKRQKSFAN